MRVNEVAKRLSVSRFTIYKWIDKGILEAISIEGTLRIRRASVETLEQNSKVKPTKGSAKDAEKTEDETDIRTPELVAA